MTEERALQVVRLLNEILIRLGDIHDSIEIGLFIIGFLLIAQAILRIGK